ncbi:hypothetical protein [Streptomyces sp. PH10-H1]|uniref:hypothetical protein n=1 Tax=Streptomyces sp. PH10-H1 TaxID=3046212 RepID=UPI0024BB3986|nr:hypothetical protein [Streptomyces sp. PH10-H1]MDJ0346741.1 hypothetical protein [Streptomyces sp. PH10-H1]
MRIRTTAITAATVVAGLMLVSCNTNDVAKSTPATGKSAPAVATDGTPDAKASADKSLALTDTATYENKVKVSLGKFTRGTSGENGFPASTAYVKFTATITNGSAKPLDLSLLQTKCQYGDTGKEGEQIFDSEHGIEGAPTTHLLPGRTSAATIACAMPKAEHYLQIEVTPDFESTAAIFAGKLQ